MENPSTSVGRNVGILGLRPPEQGADEFFVQKLLDKHFISKSQSASVLTSKVMEQLPLAGMI